MRQRRATRDDVARLARTSTAVVSYVINDGPRRVSEERRQRVLSAMAELDYHPNAIARSLAATATRTFGMILPNIANAYFSELALAVEEAATARDHLLFLGNSNEDVVREEAYISSFMEQQVAGVIIIGVAQSSSIERATNAQIPVVVVDRPLEDSDAATVSIDHREAAFQATRHLIEHGHRRIACLTGPAGDAVAEARHRGWMDALESASVDPGQQLELHSPFSLEGGYRAYDQISNDARPAAMFIASDEQARGVIAAAHNAGVAVPQELAVTAVDGTREGRFGSPSLTSVRQPYRRLAALAVDQLLTVPAPTGRHIYAESELVIGHSCGCAAS